MNSVVAQSVTQTIEAVLPQATDWRHDLHAHPQTAYEETYAAALVERVLSEQGIEHRTGLATTGIVAWITPTDPAAAAQPGIALRADMDALPITEQTGVPYASQNPGCMHACGHDGHTAMLLGAACVLNGLRDQLPRPVKFVFQPAEEGGAGAAKMIDEGALDPSLGGFAIDLMFGLHGWPSLCVGHVGVRTGPMMAANDRLYITLHGKGSHAAQPQNGVDPIVAAAQVVTALQTVVARNVDPSDAAVVSITSIHAGNTFNVIPAQLEMLGTIRTVDEATRSAVHSHIERIVTHTAEAHGCTVDLRIESQYPVTVNHQTAVTWLCDAAAGCGAVDEVEMLERASMGAEDFAFYAQRLPAAFARLGLSADPKNTRNPLAPLHSPHFDFNDAALPVGIATHCHLALHQPA